MGRFRLAALAFVNREGQMIENIISENAWKQASCPHCGMIHQTTCPRIKAIEYNQDGATVKRIEFHAPEKVVTGKVDLNLPTHLWPRS
jgi:hypothetical protein